MHCFIKFKLEDGVDIMKIAYRFSFFLLICMFLCGCGNKTAGIEGKIIDGQEKPVSGVSIIFKQVQLMQGYEQFETKTGADGKFQITGIAPSSDYIITILSDKWSTNIAKKIKTLESGKNLVLTTPIKIRFNQMKDGTIFDTMTGLQWLIYPVADITATNVKNTVNELREAGFADWRLPSRMELAGIQENSELNDKTCCVWVAETNSKSVDWIFYVEEKNEIWTSRKELPENRIVVVRDLMPATAKVPAAPVAKP
jgi:hypothetical protein